MLRGELYRADDPELAAGHARAQELLERYNATRHAEQDERDQLLRELLAEVGDGVVVKPPFRCDYGSQISIGAGTFVNYDCVLLDVAPIRIGAACQLATRVQLLTATHPVDPEPRRAGWEYGEPITIGDNVWLGGGVIVCPGVTIGDDAVVGAGAVVTRDLPAGVVAAGNPARVLRTIDTLSADRSKARARPADLADRRLGRVHRADRGDLRRDGLGDLGLGGALRGRDRDRRRRAVLRLARRPLRPAPRADRGRPRRRGGVDGDGSQRAARDAHRPLRALGGGAEPVRACVRSRDPEPRRTRPRWPAPTRSWPRRARRAT